MTNISKVKPASLEYPSGWYAGTTEKYMSIGGPYETRERAIEAGRHGQGGEPFYICMAALYNWDAPSADDVMDRWIDNHDGLWWDDEFGGFDGPKEAEVAAEEDLQSVLNDWFNRHKSILPTPTAFRQYHDGEWIDMPAPETNDVATD